MLGGIGFLAAIGLTAWALHDLADSSKFVQGASTTVSKIDIVAVAGVTPGLVSLLVIAAGAYLRVRSLETVGHLDEEPLAELDLRSVESPPDGGTGNGALVPAEPVLPRQYRARA